MDDNMEENQSTNLIMEMSAYRVVKIAEKYSIIDYSELLPSEFSFLFENTIVFTEVIKKNVARCETTAVVWIAHENQEDYKQFTQDLKCGNWCFLVQISSHDFMVFAPLNTLFPNSKFCSRFSSVLVSFPSDTQEFLNEDYAFFLEKCKSTKTAVASSSETFSNGEEFLDLDWIPSLTVPESASSNESSPFSFEDVVSPLESWSDFVSSNRSQFESELKDNLAPSAKRIKPIQVKLE